MRQRESTHSEIRKVRHPRLGVLRGSSFGMSNEAESAPVTGPTQPWLNRIGSLPHSSSAPIANNGDGRINSLSHGSEL